MKCSLSVYGSSPRTWFLFVCWLSSHSFFFPPHSHHLVFSSSPATQPTLHNSWKIFTNSFLFSNCWRKALKRSLFGMVFLCFARKWLIFARLCLTRGQAFFCLFVCFGGIGCTVPYIITFCVYFLPHAQSFFMIFDFCYEFCCWRPFFISAVFHTFCNQKCHRWTFVINCIMFFYRLSQLYLRLQFKRRTQKKVPQRKEKSPIPSKTFFSWRKNFKNRSRSIIAIPMTCFSVDLFPELYLLMNQTAFDLVHYFLFIWRTCWEQNQLNEFGTIGTLITGNNCVRFEFPWHVWVLFSVRYRNIYSSKSSECFASNVDFIQIPLASFFLVSFLPHFLSFPTVLSSSVDLWRGDGLNIAALYTSTLHM